MSEMYVAVDTCLACTAWNLFIVLARPWPGAGTVGSVWKKMTAWLPKERKKMHQLKDEDHGGKIDAESKKKHRVQRAQSVERDPPTGKAVPKFCLCIAESALQLVSKDTQKKA